MADIQPKGLTWKDRLCEKVYERSRQEAMHPLVPEFPNTDEPYHAGYRGTDQTPTYKHPAVYLKGKAPSLEFEVKPLSGTVPVRVSVTNFNLSVQTPGYPFNASATFANNKATITCPSLKDEVNLMNASLQYTFECRFQDGYWAGLYSGVLYEVGGLRLYSVYAKPTLRSNSNYIPTDVPWDELLAQTCTWAAGKSTELDVAEKLTTGLFSSGVFAYVPESALIDRLIPMRFALGLCVDKSRNGTQNGNCFDVSDYLCICANMQGLGFQVSALMSDPPPAFRANLICLIGQDPSINGSYSMPDWAIHQVARSSSQAVYDVCAAQKKDLTGADYRKPPINWPLPGFWQTLTVSGVPLGMVFAVVNENGFVQQQSSPTAPYGEWGAFPALPYTPQAF